MAPFLIPSPSLPASTVAMVIGALQASGFCILPHHSRNNSINHHHHHRRRVLTPQSALFRRRFHLLVRSPPPPPSLPTRPRLIWKPTRAEAGVPDKVDGGGDDRAKGLRTKDNLSLVRPLFRFAGANFLPLALVSGVILGLVNPTAGCLAQKYSLSKYSTFGIFVISGLMLKSEEIGLAAEAWPAALYGLISILLITPLLSRFILQLHLTPQEFVNGLAIFCCMPTTLSSGVTLTQLVKGNSALALAVTVLSNLFGILFIPFSLSNFIGQKAGVSIPTKQLFQSLTFMLLIPLIFGKVLRDSFIGIPRFVDGNRRRFSMLSAILLSLVPWMQVSRSRTLLLTVKPAFFLVALLLGVFLHLVLLAINIFVLQSLSVISGDHKSVFSKKENARAVIIVASQKTLPVMVAVVEQLGGALGESGLLVLPCIGAHIIQIVIDSFLVNFWLQKDQLSTARNS